MSHDLTENQPLISGNRESQLAYYLVLCELDKTIFTGGLSCQRSRTDGIASKPSRLFRHLTSIDSEPVLAKSHRKGFLH